MPIARDDAASVLSGEDGDQAIAWRGQVSIFKFLARQKLEN
jgi:hypothetical protein